MKLRNLHVIMLSSFVVASCSDYEKIPDSLSSGAIMFMGQSAVTSRSATNSFIMPKMVVPLVCDTDTLYLNLYESERGYDDLSISRGTPVAEIAMNESFAAYCIARDSSRQWSYMSNVEVRNTGTGYEYSPLRYWPGSDYALDFYTYYPYNATGVTFNSPDGKQPEFDFNVPAKVEDQPDLMMASKINVAGNFNAVVDLNFNHLLSRVKFISPATGALAAGNLYSISVVGLCNAAHWNGQEWSLYESTSDFSVSVGNSYTNGQDYSTDGRTLMMLPQQLDNVSINIDFESSNTGRKTYTANLAGTWEQGKSYSYTITISPEYSFEITPDPATVDSENSIDAHYDRFMVTVTPKYVGDNDRWTLTCGVDGAKFIKNDDYNLAANENGENGQYALLRQGYWIDKIIDTKNGNRESVLGETQLAFIGSGEQKVWVYVPENIGANARPIPLSITYNNQEVVKYTEVTQYAPYWDGNIGAEHIDTSEAEVWGFAWKGQTTYTRPKSGWDIFTRISAMIIYNQMHDLIKDLSYVTSTTDRFIWTWYETITVDYDKITLSGVAESNEDGLKNTGDIYTFRGFDNVTTIINQLDSYNWTKSGTATAVNPTQYAALAVIRNCNKWNVERTEETQTGTTAISYTPQLLTIEWYLPASGECNEIRFQDATGTYWTSTAVTGSNILSGLYTAPSGPSVQADRSESHKVRAFRRH